MTARLSAAWLALPVWLRQFLRDAAEGALGAVLVLNLVIPGTLQEAQATALVLVTAVSGPVIAAARRHVLPAVLRWLASTFPAPEADA